MGEVEFNIGQGAHKALSKLHAQIKEMREKKAKIEEELEKTKNEIADFSEKRERGAAKADAGQNNKKKPRPKWHEECLFFTATSGNLAVAGRNAKQNDELAAKHLTDADLFFHADIQGAPATILAGGKKVLSDAAEGNAAAVASLRETAQWAASFSSAWKTGASTVDVYAVSSSQVSKHAMGGYVGRGAFAIEGEREWFRATPLGVKIGADNGVPVVMPACHLKKLHNELQLAVGRVEKDAMCRQLSATLSCKMEEIAHLLPSGKFSIV